MEWEKFQSSTSRTLQAADRRLGIEGLSTSQGQSSIRIEGSCGKTVQGAQGLLALQKAKDPTLLRITFFQWIFHGNHSKSA